MSNLRLRPPLHRVDPRARRWWTLQALVSLSGPALLTALTLLVLSLLFFPGALFWLGPLLLVDARAWITLGAVAAGFAVVSLMGLGRWLTTRYRVAGDQVELRSGILVRRRHTVPLSRIRSVDLTATLVHRVLGLSVVRIGTADHKEVRLEALARDAAAALRGELLRGTPGRADGDPVPSAFDPRWVRYAPLTFWTFGSSPFGRRAGVVTLTAAVAAGEQGYSIRDLAAGEAPALAEAAAPRILTEFLSRTP
ncbi:PH domain-containing protein [Nonomuraea solani]|uniref:PH domain-containing protein n=1 Tax=Nonomuraea solani TaxID=1144553 RepID=A0A1H6EM30_9ACTN|nr:PH domain-containing protein [Nonomuraea solani]SEG97945.1 PH domain-containing protein [Nonomuraea solani]